MITILGAFFSPIVAFFKTPAGRWVALGLACLAVLLLANRCGYASGVRTERARDTKAQAAATALLIKQAAAQASRADDLRAQLAAALVDNALQTQTLIKKVPIYVTRKADAACTVPAGFVQLWNAGASGQRSAPQAPGGLVDAPSGVALSAVAAADLANYGVAFGWREEALIWRKWYADLVAHWSDKR